MIISKISHGLGNQLFQYAIARKISLQKHTSLYLDLRYYHHVYASDTFRSFRLNHFNVDYKVFDDAPVLIYLSKLTKLFPNRSFSPFFKLIREGNDGFNGQALKENALFVYLSGFWQSEKYFKDIEETLQNELTLRTKPSELYTKYLDLIGNETNAVSLHIRRGDYVNNSQFKDQFGFLGLDYYKRAVDMFNQEVAGPRFFIFSDDLEWVKENLTFVSNLTFVDCHGENSDIEELMLMRACHHHIIANSSFSWWGAWLNKRKDKKVVAPKKWFNNMPGLNTDDLIPSNWIRL
jgi:hypothetical protein